MERSKQITCRNFLSHKRSPQISSDSIRSLAGNMNISRGLQRFFSLLERLEPVRSSRFILVPKRFRNGLPSKAEGRQARHRQSLQRLRCHSSEHAEIVSNSLSTKHVSSRLRSPVS